MKFHSLLAYKSLARGLSVGIVLAALAGWATGCRTQPTPPLPPSPPPIGDIRIDPDRELMIRELQVVNSPRATDPSGPWHVRSLFASMAGTEDPSAFVLAWLRTWETDQVINGLTVAARPEIGPRVINPWKRASNQEGVPDSAARLDWSRAPFRLLAIVNRMDLARVTPSGAVENAGEGRFVFGVTDLTQPDPATTKPEFTVIFEYQLPARSRVELRAWADRWHGLGQSAGFGEAYLAGLETVTRAFANGTAGPVVLNQIRTDEVHLRGPWELREFHLAGQPARLLPAPVRLTPDLGHNGTPLLGRWFAANHEAILANNHQVTNRFEGQVFLAGSALNPIPRVIWDAPTVDRPARQLVALATCNGCHGPEAGMGPFEFTHVKPRVAPEMAGLSGFLTGTRFPDPGQPGVPLEMNDLLVRSNALSKVVAAPVPARSPSRSPGGFRLFTLNVPDDPAWAELREFYRSRRARAH